MKQSVWLVLLIFYSFLAIGEDTALKLYRPFREGKDSPLVIKQLQGRCDAQSRLILREDAWRCQVEGAVYDPCFVGAGTMQKRVLCPSSPWSVENIQININKSLDNEDHQTLDMSRTFPWAIELVNGERCLAVENGGQYDSIPIRYSCNGQNRLVGTIQRCHPLWSMLEKTSNGVITVDFKTVWF